MNRGSEDARIAEGDAIVASMRPRFMNRGSTFGIPSAYRKGRGFNEAPIHESGKLFVVPTLVMDAIMLQ